jgi:hypothetical protein
MLVAAGLAGAFGRTTDDANRNIWKGLCRNLSFQLQDGFLRALFGLLASEGNWTLVLNESTSLSLSDRMIIALRFLDDQALSLFISKWVPKLQKQGRIDGILLTGWTTEGLDLMEAYLDRSGDIQTIALLLVRQNCPPDPRISMWIDTYRDMLDQWQLFKTRALLDIFCNQRNRNIENIPSQIFIRCNFCNQTISQGSKPKKSGFIPSTITLPSRTKPIACPTCSKSLPRCTICLVPMGTAFETGSSMIQDASGIWY